MLLSTKYSAGAHVSGEAIGVTTKSRVICQGRRNPDAVKNVNYSTVPSDSIAEVT